MLLLLCELDFSELIRHHPSFASEATGFSKDVTQLSLYVRELGVAIVQTSFDIGESHERAALNAWLSSLELEGVLIPPLCQESFRLSISITFLLLGLDGAEEFVATARPSRLI